MLISSQSIKKNLKVGFEHSTSNSINYFHKNVEHF